MPSFGFAIDRRHTRNDAGALGQRLLTPTARHAACSASSGGRLTARGAPGSRCKPLTKRRGATQFRAEFPTTVSPEERFLPDGIAPFRDLASDHLPLYWEK